MTKYLISTLAMVVFSATVSWASDLSVETTPQKRSSGNFVDLTPTFSDQTGPEAPINTKRALVSSSDFLGPWLSGDDLVNSDQSDR